MTDREKAIVMAHTGICMLTGEKYGVFHKYIEDILGRPVYTHELAIQSISDEIKEKSRDDFIKLCKEEQEPCEDAISRQAVQDYIAKYLSQYLYNDVREAVEVIDEYIGELPPVTPQPKTGHWEWVQYDYNPKLGNWHCSECRCIVVECVDKEEKGGIPLYKYCPQCGAKMQEAEIEG